MSRNALSVASRAFNTHVPHPACLQAVRFQLFDSILNKFEEAMRTMYKRTAPVFVEDTAEVMESMQLLVLGRALACPHIRVQKDVRTSLPPAVCVHILLCFVGVCPCVRYGV